MSQDKDKHGAQLIQRLREGDESALNDLMDKYQEQFRRYIFTNYPRLSNDAEDIVQDTFIKVLEDPYQIEQPERFSGWGYRVIKNRCIDLAKKKSPQLLDSIEDTDDPHGEAVHVSTHTDEKHRDVFIHKKWTFFDSIKRLPIRHQTVLDYLNSGKSFPTSRSLNKWKNRPILSELGSSAAKKN